MKRISRLLLCLPIFIILGVASVSGATRQITDMAGRKIKISDPVDRIACMQGPSYEMVFALGAADRIALVRSDHKSAYPLALKTYPPLADIQSLKGVGPKSPVNIEEYIKINPGMVIYWSIPQELKKFDTVGIPAVVVNWSSSNPRNIDEALADQKRKLGFLAEVLGEGSMKRYNEWAAYSHKNVEVIRSRLKDIPQSERPSVYMGNSWGTNILSTWGGFSSHNFVIEACGGKFRGVKGPGMFPEVTREQLISWAPDVLIVDNHGRFPEKVIENLKTSPDWASIPAVKNDRVFQIPSGVFFLDKGTSSTVYMLWLAKQLHPNHFQDVNVVEHLKYFYSNFYDYQLTTAEARQVLAGRVNSTAYSRK